MRVVAAVLAAGKGERFGGDKLSALLGGKPVWRWSYDVLKAHPLVEAVGLVGGAANLEVLRAAAPEAAFVVAGGSTRLESVRAAVEAVPQGADVLLVHDGARPFVSSELIDAVIAAASEAGAAAPAIPVRDTIRRLGPEQAVVPRQGLGAMQTPQAVRLDLLRAALSGLSTTGSDDLTDDVSLAELLGVRPLIVEGDERNFKITVAEDLRRARASVLGGSRTGIGYDIHRFSDNPQRPLWLGGVRFPGERGLEGHSDADPLLHAVVDALLGAAGLGDIGAHFPPSDPQWKDCPSSVFLQRAGELVHAEGWEITNVDATLLAERPKILGRIPEMRQEIGSALLIDPLRISVKATTLEGLGALGRGEGIAAMAVATLTLAGP